MVPKRHTHLNKPTTFSFRFKYAFPFVTTCHERVKNCSNMIFSALRIFSVVLLSESIKRLVSNVWNLANVWNRSSFEIIHTRIDDRQFVWYYFYVRSQVLWPITRTKILSKFQIILKLPAVKSCACLLEFPATEFDGFVVSINRAAWSVMWETGVKDFVILIVIFPILVESSYHGRFFAFALSPMIPM